MKTKILLLLLFCSGLAFSQVTIKENEIMIDVDSNVKSFETVIEYIKENPGKNKYNIIAPNPKGYSISIKKNANMQPVLQFDKAESNNGVKINKDKVGEITFKRNTELTITITTTDKDPVEKVYKIKTQTDWMWTTTFGANAIFYTNHNRFISQTDNGLQKVTEIQSNKTTELMPTVMFNFMDYQDTISYGFTGGLGINFEEIAVFAGLSLGIGQNIILTGGVGVHKQTLPNANYFVGQTIDSSVTNDNLNESQYRINPFIGISFRLDKNPFKK
ncbi:hypothetical protein J2799_002329 [Chryseobacterium vietnamense]|uniref:hypothetical protein n=1 Tax=Chryseobacterium vietnamense TaxID=866785 RepID=UPI00285C068E|nr:hypothetical protein [Chryseobacterium vietnamense]MDR6487824.1 hypothetical protein [Chryseobacterium vietnamense]